MSNEACPGGNTLLIVLVLISDRSGFMAASDTLVRRLCSTRRRALYPAGATEYCHHEYSVSSVVAACSKVSMCLMLNSSGARGVRPVGGRAPVRSSCGLSTAVAFGIYAESDRICRTYRFSSISLSRKSDIRSGRIAHMLLSKAVMACSRSPERSSGEHEHRADTHPARRTERLCLATL